MSRKMRYKDEYKCEKYKYYRKNSRVETELEYFFPSFIEEIRVVMKILNRITR